MACGVAQYNNAAAENCLWVKMFCFPQKNPPAVRSTLSLWVMQARPGRWVEQRLWDFKVWSSRMSFLTVILVYTIHLRTYSYESYMLYSWPLKNIENHDSHINGTQIMGISEVATTLGPHPTRCLATLVNSVPAWLFLHKLLQAMKEQLAFLEPCIQGAPNLSWCNITCYLV